MSHFARKAALGAVAFAMAGSTVFGGAALADPKDGGVSDLQDATSNANGGNNECLNGIPILSGGLALAVGGNAENSVCNANGGSATATNRLGG